MAQIRVKFSVTNICESTYEVEDDALGGNLDELAEDEIGCNSPEEDREAETGAGPSAGPC